RRRDGDSAGQTADHHAGGTLGDDRSLGRDRRRSRLGRALPRAGLVAAAKAGRLMRALHAEGTKLRTLPSTGWLMLLAILGTAGVGLAITGSLKYNHCRMPCTLDTTKLTLGGVRLGQVGILVLAVLAVTAEYSTRTIRPTLTAMPRRFPVVLGKLVVLAVL